MAEQIFGMGMSDRRDWKNPGTHTEGIDGYSLGLSAMLPAWHGNHRERYRASRRWLYRYPGLLREDFWHSK